MCRDLSFSFIVQKLKFCLVITTLGSHENANRKRISSTFGAEITISGKHWRSFFWQMSQLSCQVDIKFRYPSRQRREISQQHPQSQKFMNHSPTDKQNHSDHSSCGRLCDCCSDLETVLEPDQHRSEPELGLSI